ncbi:MAG: carbohydrate ABC transporter permease [Clostridiaceae bacterium]|nr:carbohydrate ABC transporter permease [Eubacteriales bacterium]NLV48786.1 carbohydrate ABC transporter permease [Clostridiaceae bacterium]
MKSFSFRTLFIRFILLFWSVVVVIPFAMLLLTSLKTNPEFYANVWALPQDLFGSLVINYREAFARGSIGTNFLNTVYIDTVALIITLTLSAMVSYVIARRPLRFAPKLYYLYLVGLLIPAMVGLTPMFIMARFLGLFDTRFILILLYGTSTIPFCVFVMTAFFRSILNELEEAASIDGANLWHIFGRIILPLVKPAFITAGIFCFLDYWSEYMKGLMFVVSAEKKTISMGMLTFKIVSGFKIDWGVTAAACILFILPVLVLYIAFQRHLIGGLTDGSVKG